MRFCVYAFCIAWSHATVFLFKLTFFAQMLLWVVIFSLIVSDWDGFYIIFRILCIYGVLIECGVDSEF